MFPSHDLTPSPPSSLAATPPKSAESAEAKSGATEANPNSHRAQERANAPKINQSDAAPTTKLQYAQVHISDQHSSGSSIGDDTIRSNDNATEYSTRDNNLNTGSSIRGCYYAFNPSGDGLNYRAKVTSIREDSDSGSNSTSPLSACDTRLWQHQHQHRFRSRTPLLQQQQRRL
jgi:hypothetical protein